MHKTCFTVSFISCLYMFRAHVLIIRRSKLHYTASGIIKPVGLKQFWPLDDEHMCSKHVEAWNKTYCETNFVHQLGLNTEINILRCSTVSEMTKFICLSWCWRKGLKAEFHVFIILHLNEDNWSELNWVVSREYDSSAIWIVLYICTQLVQNDGY